MQTKTNVLVAGSKIKSFPETWLILLGTMMLILGLVEVQWIWPLSLFLWKFVVGFDSRHLQASCFKQLFGVQGIIKQLASAVIVKKTSLLIPPTTKKQQLHMYQPHKQTYIFTN